ncbi:AroB-related putative sugar phosphate phospholyase (cyclizing) [Polynucleobacter sp. Adler-ghost]|uniref:AroB-related putative sugar phosphate phospholyase (cyclizing) n=1 Tax=Polynucleobacter sp. Adler-ghost TaxID=2770234 RepID=UPI001BFE4AB3|nr:AroB-related putative sugar phosphate phospholyase (cyclizing) [Polynucleobacter sp. Adler-ghost]QWE31053.1 iron-containing alcohol dehydrogenase [Polynucleobacter sp. Adler-ghost]
MSDNFKITSSRGVYEVNFVEDFQATLEIDLSAKMHFIIDKKVACIYGSKLEKILSLQNTIQVEAVEASKSLENTTEVIKKIVRHGIRRDHCIVAIGGGVIQDITCFISSILLRGIGWQFYPTTLLSQADSCIGSKSSINIDSFKNILGTFWPPEKVFICSKFLTTLSESEIASGVGEIIKAHAIKSRSKFDEVATLYKKFECTSTYLDQMIIQSLEIKKEYIERDEFDVGIRNLFNYGHSFGHAIESATNFTIPHGIAVTIGMDMANYISYLRGLLPVSEFERMHSLLASNYALAKKIKINVARVIEGLSKDKKNLGDQLVVLLPIGSDAKITKVSIDLNDHFKNQCSEFFKYYYS